MLPKVSGLDICKQLRLRQPHPDYLVNGSGQEIDKVMGLELGADDYVTKPFSFMELVARVEALLRRAVKTGRDSRLCPSRRFNSRLQ